MVVESTMFQVCFETLGILRVASALIYIHRKVRQPVREAEVHPIERGKLVSTGKGVGLIRKTRTG